MAEWENPLLNEFCAADAGAATQSRRLRIRFKGPAPCPVPDPNAGQCLKQSVNACKSFNRNRIADNGKKLNFSNLWNLGAFFESCLRTLLLVTRINGYGNRNFHMLMGLIKNLVVMVRKKLSVCSLLLLKITCVVCDAFYEF